MSRIFDALLRAQAERSGADQVEAKSATDLVQQAERQVSSPVDGRSSLADRSRVAQESTLRRRKAGEVSAGEASITALFDSDPRLAGLKDALLEFQDRTPSLPEDSRLVCVTDRESPAAEAFRLLGVRVRRLRSQNLGNKLLITSTAPEEGKSTIAANLACTLAKGSQQTVLLVDGDLRRPVLADMFGLHREPGLCEYLRGTNEITSSIYKINELGFWFLPAGDSFGNVLELLQSSELPSMMGSLAALFDWIIIDSPPMLPLADTSIWERWADGILLVTRQGVTRKHALQRGLEAFSGQGKLVGSIINSFDGLRLDDYYYYRPTREDSGRQPT